MSSKRSASWTALPQREREREQQLVVARGVAVAGSCHPTSLFQTQLFAVSIA